MGEIIKSNKNSIRGYKASISFLAIVVIFTTVLYFYNNSVRNDVEDLNASIASIESNIKEVEKDKRLQIYSLLELNKKVIKSYELMNKVTAYIDHMNEIAIKYNLEFSGFNLTKGEITTNAKIISDDDGIAFQKARDFINQYRADEEALFELQFINSIEGMDDIKFRVNFKIK